MRSLKRPFTIVAITAFATTMALASSATATAPPPVDGAGTVACEVVSSLMFSPALTVGGTAPTTVSFKATLKNCTGTGDGANVKTAKSTVVTTWPANDCLALQTAPTSSLSGPLTWKTKPHTQKINPSTITFTGGSVDMGPPIAVDATGSSTAGSFNGDAAATHAVLKEDFAKLAKKCQNMHGLRSIHIGAGSTFSLN